MKYLVMIALMCFVFGGWFVQEQRAARLDEAETSIKSLKSRVTRLETDRNELVTVSEQNIVSIDNLRDSIKNNSDSIGSLLSVLKILVHNQKVGK